jgi:hypothetical protein
MASPWAVTPARASGIPIVSASKELFVFPDTNVFLQCRPLEAVDWKSFGEWDRINVFLTRPVQKEIDGLKGRGNSRLAARARSASPRIKELLKAPEKTMELRSSPSVYLCLRHDLREDPDVNDILNYEERDDQLVGTALAFQKANPEFVARVLTYDTGPMTSADAVGMGYLEVPESWLLAPEPDEFEKRARELQAELEKYRKAEPTFQVEFVGYADQRFQASVTMYSALSEQDVLEFMERLVANYPIATDFGPSKREERTPSLGVSTSLFNLSKDVFEPATEDEVDRYESAYAKWKTGCESTLRSLHELLNSAIEWPTVTFGVENVGSRPADDALVVLTVEGSLQLVVPKDGVEEEGGEADWATPEDALESVLPQPPEAPKGTWKRVDPYRAVYGGLADALSSRRTFPHDNYSHLLSPPVMEVRDPNGIYLKDGTPGELVSRLEYECAQWRHAHGAEDFEVNIQAPLQPKSHSGLLKVVVHAANLTTPAEVRLPVAVVVEQTPSREIAEKLLEQLIDPKAGDGYP